MPLSHLLYPLLLMLPPDAVSASVVSLNRFAVKGLGPSSLTSVVVSDGETFPDDRRFALLRRVHSSKFDPRDPVWIHKENFLCAFSNPDLLARFYSEYEQVRRIPCDDDVGGEGDSNDDGNGALRAAATRRTLTVWRRDPTSGIRIKGNLPALGPVDLATESGRAAVGKFFSAESGEDVICVSAADDENRHTHQFGNTQSGVRERGDTRTIHIVNAATVRELSKKLGVSISPERFRPNVVVDGIEPWAEFGWVGRSLHVHSGANLDNSMLGKEDVGMILDVISRTVRCEGIGIDPDDPRTGKLDIPRLLQQHYPEHGPYLGVYAVVVKGGCLNLGDDLTLLDHT